MNHDIFALDERVSRTSVAYKDRCGITISGGLYRAENLKDEMLSPAILIDKVERFFQQNLQQNMEVSK